MTQLVKLYLKYVNSIVMAVFFAAIIVSCTNEQLSNPSGQISEDTGANSSAGNKGTATLTEILHQESEPANNAITNQNPINLIKVAYQGSIGNVNDVDYYPIDPSFTNGSLQSPLIRAEVIVPAGKKYKLELVYIENNVQMTSFPIVTGTEGETLWLSRRVPSPNPGRTYYIKISSFQNSIGSYELRCRVTQKGKRFLFDAAHAQDAGDEDWTIDGTSNRLPTPSQLKPSNELDNDMSWTGRYSAAGLFLAKQGHEVQSLPSGSLLTYFNNNSPTDLTKFDVLVLLGPNKRYSQAEITAIRSFITAGGGVLMAADHTTDLQEPDGSIPNMNYVGCNVPSDLDGDGWDSPRILNQILRTHVAAMNSYDMGFKFDMASVANTCDVSYVSSNKAALGNPHVDYLLKGLNNKQGYTGIIQNLNSVSSNWGTTLSTTTSNIGVNSNGLFWNQGAAKNTLDFSRAAISYDIHSLDKGRIAAFGDVSMFADGTGNPAIANSNVNRWFNDPNGNSENHRNLFINALLWLAKHE